jgi:hypothetical protein
MHERTMSLPQALAWSMCAEHADAHGRVIVCQSQKAVFNLYVHEQWTHCLSAEEAAEKLVAISVDVTAGWSPVNAQGD